MGTRLELSEAVERNISTNKCDESDLAKFEQLKDLVKDMSDATSVVSIVAKAQSVRDKRNSYNTTEQISSYIRIKRKRLGNQTLKRTKYDQRNILKGLEAYMDKSRSAGMFKTLTFTYYNKSTKTSELDKFKPASLAKTIASRHTHARSL